jgi:hypothetical protein
MNLDGSRHDRLIGAICVVVCPAISGVFLGLVAVLCVYPSGGDHAIKVGALVGCVALVANAFAICLTAATTESHAHRRAREAVVRSARSRSLAR